MPVNDMQSATEYPQGFFQWFFVYNDSNNMRVYSFVASTMKNWFLKETNFYFCRPKHSPCSGGRNALFAGQHYCYNCYNSHLLQEENEKW